MAYDILNITKDIAMKMGDYDTMLKIMEKKDNQRTWRGLEFPAFSLLTLSHGLPGICLLYGELMKCFPEEEKWGKLAHNYLSIVVEELNKNGFQSLSMFSGAAGVALSVTSISNDFQNYNKLLNTLNDYILNRFEEVYSGMLEGKGTHSLYYDVIEGLSGVLSYLGIYQKRRKFHNVIIRGLELLVHLTEDIVIQRQYVPGWYIPVENQFTKQEKELYPKGNFNTSLSHGIAGPLSILSEMMIEGITVEGQEEAIKKITNFLFHYKLNDGERDFWKGQIDFDEVINRSLTKENVIRRDAWCYGNPGICYAIISAGVALKNRFWIDYGIKNLRATMKHIYGIFSPTFCHGYAGLYQLLNSVETLVQEELFLSEKIILKEKILSFYNPDYIYGFKNLEYDNEAEKIKPYDVCGLLEGATGVCLALLEGENKGRNLWTRAFLLM